MVSREEGLHQADNNDEQSRQDQEEPGKEEGVEDFTPAKMWMRSTSDSLREEEVDDVDGYNASLDEDLSRNKEIDVLRLVCRSNPQRTSDCSGRAETFGHH